MTGKMTTIARPYAIAAFESALANNALAAWEALLNAAALVAEDPLVVRVLTNPAVSSKDLEGLFCDVLTSMLDDEKRNFIRLLAEKQRLAALPDIAELFRQYRAEHEKTLSIQVTSAIALESSYQTKLMNSLTKRLQRKVTLECHTDPTLLGGAIVRAGDTVIDGSVRGKLNRLLESL